tara:strand:- start:156 stop:1298 length:1143 start_codon:yes stop_codon:yes gene_type:complete
MNKKISLYFRSIYLIFIVFSFSLFTILNPFHNWDIIGYTSSAYSLDGIEGQNLLDKTYQDVKEEVSIERFIDLTTSSSSESNYKSTVFSNEIALKQQLPFYKVRIAYVYLINFIGKIIGSYSKATWIISLISSSLTLLMLSLIFFKKLETIFFIGFPILIGISLSHLSRSSTPDSLSVLIGLAGLLSYKEKKLFPGIFLISIIPIFRTDYIILPFLFSLYFFIKKDRFLSIKIFTSALFFYIASNTFANNYGYLTIFNFNFISGITPFPEDIIINTSIVNYIKPYLRGFITFKNLLTFPLIFSFLAHFLSKPNQIIENKYFIQTLITLLFVVIHFCLFPAAFQRSYLLFNIMVYVYFMESISEIKISEIKRKMKNLIGLT